MTVFEGPVRSDADSILARYPEAHRRSAVIPTVNPRNMEIMLADAHCRNVSAT